MGAPSRFSVGPSAAEIVAEKPPDASRTLVPYAGCEPLSPRTPARAGLAEKTYGMECYAADPRKAVQGIQALAL